MPETKVRRLYPAICEILMNLLTAAECACILRRNRARVPAKKRSRTIALFIFKAMRKKSTPAFAHTESGRMV